ncbi:MAG: type II toxin-antitoxin system RelE/ParE family toxin [Deltaproteobacteria bacterium]|nr:type II toxin-antitoxin system RelE/ParE family toxin [Deltaproteobacteria bacterium]
MVPIRRIKPSTELAAFLRSLPPAIKRKVRGGLDALLKNPYEGKPLRAELTGLWSLRVGRFRIIYRWHESVLDVLAIGPRESIYPTALERFHKLPEK